MLCPRVYPPCAANSVPQTPLFPHCSREWRRRRSPEGDRRLRLFPLPSGTRGKDQYHKKSQPHPRAQSFARGIFSFPPNDKKIPLTLANQGLIGIRQRLILPGRVQPSTFSTGELNCCVRDGNRWNLSVIATGNGSYFIASPFSSCFHFTYLHLKEKGRS